MQHGSWDYSLVLLSYVVSVFGAYCCLELVNRLRRAAGGAFWGWLILAAFALGGGAIWSMHFIGMLALKMDMPVAYDFTLTLLSALLAVGVTALGLFVVGRGQVSLGKLIAAGLVTGTGVATMHYTGMAAMIMPMDVRYKTGLFILSIVIAMVAATAALWIVFNLHGRWQRFASAFVMGAAVCGMHYTGMLAAEMTPNNKNIEIPASAIQSESMAVYIFAASMILLTVLLFVSLTGAERDLELAET